MDNPPFFETRKEKHVPTKQSEINLLQEEQSDRGLQWNLVNFKSSVLEGLFRVISSSYYRELDLKNITSQNSFLSFFSTKHKF